MASQVRVLLILTASMPWSSILVASSAVISSPASQMISSVTGSNTSSAVTLPRIRSPRGSMISSPSLRGVTVRPRMVPQSIVVMTTSWQTSTSLLVR